MRSEHRHFYGALCTLVRFKKKTLFSNVRCSDIISCAGVLRLLLLPLHCDPCEQFERPEEEKARDVEIAKEYSRRMFARHNLWSRQIMMRIKLRDAAIAALPEELQAEANEVPPSRLFLAYCPSAPLHTITPALLA